MAKKKITPATPEFNTLDAQKKAEESAATGLEKLQAGAGSVALNVSEEAKQMLEATGRIEQENANYAKQLSEMQDRIAGYLQEIEGLKSSLESAKKEAAEARKEAEAAKRAAPQPSAGRAAEVEIQRLKSELSMAKAEISMLKSQIETFKTGSSPRPKISPNCYRRPILDGYSTWN